MKLVVVYPESMAEEMQYALADNPNAILVCDPDLEDPDDFYIMPEDEYQRYKAYKREYQDNPRSYEAYGISLAYFIDAVMPFRPEDN